MKGLPRSLKNAGTAKAKTIPINHTITVAGATGIGFGSVVIGDFPEGFVRFLGAVASVVFTGPTSASLSDTWEGDYGVGTTPAADGTITNADVDIIASTALAAATAEVSPTTQGELVTAAIFDNSAGGLEINLNLLIDDASISADDIDMAAVGTLWISYVMLGDD